MASLHGCFVLFLLALMDAKPRKNDITIILSAIVTFSVADSRHAEMAHGVSIV